jgi:hypothetical protein
VFGTLAAIRRRCESHPSAILNAPAWYSLTNVFPIGSYNQSTTSNVVFPDGWKDEAETEMNMGRPLGAARRSASNPVGSRNAYALEEDNVQHLPEYRGRVWRRGDAIPLVTEMSRPRDAKGQNL